ncbi:hypothetical protein LINPERPRIM_LOCUS17681 [Linum perenne]
MIGGMGSSVSSDRPPRPFLSRAKSESVCSLAGISCRWSFVSLFLCLCCFMRLAPPQQIRSRWTKKMEVAEVSVEAEESRSEEVV